MNKSYKSHKFVHTEQRGTLHRENSPYVMKIYLFTAYQYKKSTNIHHTPPKERWIFFLCLRIRSILHILSSLKKTVLPVEIFLLHYMLFELQHCFNQRIAKPPQKHNPTKTPCTSESKTSGRRYKRTESIFF